MFKIEVIGNLGADIKIQEGNGYKFGVIRVAHTDKYTKDNGETIESTTWIDGILNNLDSKVIQYLKQGTKVFMRGYGSLDIYSSEKLRRMVPKAVCNIQEIELCGGSSDEVPRRLIDPSTGVLMDVRKFYWTEPTDAIKQTPNAFLIDKNGRQFPITKEGWVTAPADDNNQVDSTTQAHTETNKDGQSSDSTATQENSPAADSEKTKSGTSKKNK